MTRSPESIRKAAILVATLDPRTADALLDQMSPDLADLVRRAAVAIDVIDSQEQDTVIREFLGVGHTTSSPAGNKLHLSRSGSRETSEIGILENPITFRCLDQADCEQLMPFLEGEHPQTIAVVASHLSPARAAGVLTQLPSSLQADVLRRLVDLEEMHPEVLLDLERGLESRMAQLSNRQQRRAAGLAAVKDILAAADRGSQRSILSNLGEHAPQLALQLDRPLLPSLDFDDLTRLDAPTLMELFAQADPQVVVLALAGSDPAFVERALAAAPRREADLLRAAWQNMGPTQLSDVDAAQQELVDLARQLQRDGR